jgi:hypothetical protein
MSIISCLFVSAQFTLLLLPVPRSIMMCLFLKKNIVVQGSYSSYIVLKSGTSEMSTCGGGAQGQAHVNEARIWVRHTVNKQERAT